jgi:hypothetical protein
VTQFRFGIDQILWNLNDFDSWHWRFKQGAQPSHHVLIDNCTASVSALDDKLFVLLAT